LWLLLLAPPAIGVAGSLSKTAFARTGLPLGGDTFQEFRSRLVARILGHKPSGEGVAQDGLSQRLSGLEPGTDVGFEMCNDREVVFHGLNEGFLFGKWRQWKLESQI